MMHGQKIIKLYY